MNAHVDHRSSIIWTREEAAYIANIIRYDDWGVSPTTSVPTPASSLDAIALAPRSPTKLPSLANAALADIQQDTKTLPDVPAHRLLVLGGPGSGKTSIITRFCGGRRPFTTANEVVHDSRREHTGSIFVRAKRYTVQAFEIPSEDVIPQADNIPRLIALSHAAAVIYDATSRASFDHACGLRDRFRDAAAARDELYGFALVSNRREGQAVAVSRAEGARAAKLWGRTSDEDEDEDEDDDDDGLTTAHAPLGAVFAEVCAASGDGIEKLFTELGMHVLGLCSMRQQRSRCRLKAVAEQCPEDIKSGDMIAPQQRKRTASTLVRVMHAKKGRTEEEEEVLRAQVSADPARKQGLWKRISKSCLSFRHSKGLS